MNGSNCSMNILTTFFLLSIHRQVLFLKWFAKNMERKQLYKKVWNNICIVCMDSKHVLHLCAHFFCCCSKKTFRKQLYFLLGNVTCFTASWSFQGQHCISEIQSIQDYCQIVDNLCCKCIVTRMAIICIIKS